MTSRAEADQGRQTSGLGFVGQYPGVYASFVFALSCVVGAACAHLLAQGGLAPAVYGYVMLGWLALVLAVFAHSLQAFSVPLRALRRRALLVSGARATRHARAAEQGVLDDGVGEAEALPAGAGPDPAPVFRAAAGLSVFLVDRAALASVAAAALLPLVAAGATRLPPAQLLLPLKRLLMI